MQDRRYMNIDIHKNMLDKFRTKLIDIGIKYEFSECGDDFIHAEVLVNDTERDCINRFLETI